MLLLPPLPHRRRPAGIGLDLRLVGQCGKLRAPGAARLIRLARDVIAFVIKRMQLARERLAFRQEIERERCGSRKGRHAVKAESEGQDPSEQPPASRASIHRLMKGS